MTATVLPDDAKVELQHRTLSLKRHRAHVEERGDVPMMQGEGEGEGEGEGGEGTRAGANVAVAVAGGGEDAKKDTDTNADVGRSG
jgi:hypothetical protein